MTKENAKKWSKIFDAYSKGIPIEIESENKWYDFTSSNLPITSFIGWDPKFIRIKSKLVPFTFEDSELFKNKWIKCDLNSSICMITKFNEKSVFFGKHGYSYYQLLMFCKFEDGSPCGKYVGE